MQTIPGIFDLWKIGVRIRSKCTFWSKLFLVKSLGLNPQTCFASSRPFLTPNFSYTLGILPQRSHSDSEICRWFMKVNCRRQSLDRSKTFASAGCEKDPRDRSANRLVC